MMSGYTQVKLFSCTVVVPDPEFKFLAQTVSRSSIDVWPWSSLGDYVIEVRCCTRLG
jgi:hypothetical protein